MNIRNIFTSLRRIIPPEERRNADKSIGERLVARSEWQSAETVCLYISGSEEVDTKPLLAEALNNGKRVVVPRVDGKELSLHTIITIKDLVPGSYDLLEPNKIAPTVDPEDVGLFIVPGVAFDRNLNRMGRGYGYYDKLLSDISVPKIGLSYAIQVVAELPRTSYDVPMTMVITEEEIICQP